MKILMMLLAVLTVNGVEVGSTIPGIEVTRIHVEKVPHDQTTPIDYSDFHLFVTLSNKSSDDVQVVWAKVCFSQAKQPTCKEIQISGDWRQGREAESFAIPYWVAQQPTEIQLLRVSTARAKE